METLKAPKVREDAASDAISSNFFSPRYKLIRPLKKGGTSQLYLVQDKLCRSSSAVIKVIRKDIACSELGYKLAASEFSVACHLSHPNIINIYNVHRRSASACLVMEYLEGPSLKGFLFRESLSYRQVITLLEPIVHALEYLHDNGVVHCDIKPSNIVLAKNCTPKLIDLANCRQDSDCKTPKIRIEEDVFFGFSERYSSPQIIDDKPVTTSDDVYSLAVVIYEMLGGVLPAVNSDSPVLVLDSLDKPDLINCWQWAVLKKAMSPNQQDRYASADMFFSRFCRARRIAYVVSGSVVSSLCLLLVLGYLAVQWSEYHTRYLQYQAAQQQLDTIAATRRQVLQFESDQRHLHLAIVDGLDEFSRRMVLNELYEAVVLPITDQVDAAMLSRASSSALSQLLDKLNVLSVYYSHSKEISYSVGAIEAEGHLRLQSVIVAANDLLDSQRFDVTLASKINQLADVNQESWPQVILDTDLTAYSSAVEEALVKESWPVAIQLFQFADAINHYLPQAMDVWPNSPEIVTHVKSFSHYLSFDQNNKGYFPVQSADFFFADRLDAVNKSLSKVWFNKDIKRYTSELIEIRSEYKVPENYEPYRQVHNALIEKINNKIQYHRRSGQRQAMQYLLKLKNTLS